MAPLFSAKNQLARKANRLFRAIAYRFALLILFAGIGINGHADEADTLLTKPITISLPAENLYNALNHIGERAGCFFIYDSRDVRGSKRIKPVTWVNKPMYELLNLLVADSLVSYRVIDRHILIYRKSKDAHSGDSTRRESYLQVGGRLYDGETRQVITFATVTLNEIGLGTITNNDGAFTMRIPSSFIHASVVISHLGYQSQTIPIELLLGKKYTIYLQPRYIPIQEVIIRNIDARGIVTAMVENRYKNYASNDVYLTGFYREGVSRNNQYLGYSEAIFRIYKSAITESTSSDQVKLLKARKLEKQDRSDTLTVKLMAGIKGTLEMDIAKRLPDFIDPEYMDSYTYTKSDIIAHDSRTAYAISFEQKKGVELPLYMGTLYVDVENLALLAADFELNPKYIEKAASSLIVRKNRSVKVKPQQVSYSVSYRELNGVYYVQHIRGDISVRISSRYRLFTDSYNLFFEFVNMQIDTLNVQRFSRRDVVKPYTVFSDGDFAYDASFWGDMNFIEPEEDVARAIARINPKIESVVGE